MKNINTLRKVFLVSAFALVFGSCNDKLDLPTPASGNTIMSLITNSSDFNVLNAALIKTGQNNGLKSINSGQITLFAPNDAAFVTYLNGISATVVTETDAINFINGLTTATTAPLTMAALNGTLTYHMVSSKITSDMFVGNQVFATLNGGRLSVSKGATVVLNANSVVNGATVIGFDSPASNGVMHTIDRVMAAVATTNVLTPLGISVNYATSPPTVTSSAFNATDTDFNLFAAMIRVTGQAVILLPNAAPLPDFTIFQPNDGKVRAYFLAIDPTLTTEVLVGAYLNSLISATPPATPNPTLAQLTDLVKYHYVKGRFLTSDFTSGQTLTTGLTGNTITVTIAGAVYTLVDGNALVTDPTITTKDILTNSGILHTVSDVLRPQ